MLPHFEILAPIYDCVIPTVNPEIYRRLLDLPVDGTLLDAGGGTGRVSTPLRPWVTHLVVADPAKAMLRRAGKKGQIWRVRSFAESLPFPDDVFDRILVADALHHFQVQSRALAELIRVLSPGGRMLIEEPDITRPIIRIVALVEKLALMKSRFFTAEDIGEMVKAPGITTQIHRDGRFLAWVVIRKRIPRGAHSVSSKVPRNCGSTGLAAVQGGTGFPKCG